MFFTINLAQDSSKISPYISNTLLSEIENTLENGEKVLLYLNKRGAFSSLICEDCQHLFECPNCDVSLTVHHNPEHLLCHICHHAFRIPGACPECWWVKLKSVWIGTQELEKIIRWEFSHKNIYRFDSDSMKNISSKRSALMQLETADIIIGTKMISTGFDFDKIWLIAVILTESELGYPSYDAQERAYSNLRQLIGRGNRKSQKTKILLQSFIPKNSLVSSLTEKNYKDFLTESLAERKEFLYPPFTQMVTLEYRHKEKSVALEYMQKLQQNLKNLDTEKKYTFLKGTNTFRKNNTHHATMIIKWENIRALLWNIEITILKERNLSIIFA